MGVAEAWAFIVIVALWIGVAFYLLEQIRQLRRRVAAAESDLAKLQRRVRSGGPQYLD